MAMQSSPVISKKMHRTETQGFLAHVSMGFGKDLYDYENNFSELAVKYFSRGSLSLNQQEGSFKKKMKRKCFPQQWHCYSENLTPSKGRVSHSALFCREPANPVESLKESVKCQRRRKHARNLGAI